MREREEEGNSGTLGIAEEGERRGEALHPGGEGSHRRLERHRPYPRLAVSGEIRGKHAPPEAVCEWFELGPGQREAVEGDDRWSRAEAADVEWGRDRVSSGRRREPPTT